jgi:ketol-acid reductoisomerase
MKQTDVHVGKRLSATYISAMAAKSKAKKMIAVLGYGSQGRALAQNLRDSGFPVVVGLRSRSRSRRIAKADGLTKIRSIPDAVGAADIICFAFPDHLHGRVYEKDIRPNIRSRVTLLFLHGMSIQFRFVEPPSDCDVILIAPHAPGVAVREKYLAGRDISAFYAVYQNRSRLATATVFSLAQGMGFQRKRLVKTTFEAEALGDIFGEQAILCGGLAMLLKTGFEVLVENGLKPENAYLEVAYQIDLIVELIKKHGIAGMFERISFAARYGSLDAGPRVIDKQVKRRMRRVFADIKTGRFATKLSQLEPKDIEKVNKEMHRLTDPAFEEAARKFAR